MTELLAVVCLLCAPGELGAQIVSPEEREALVRLRVDRGGQAGDVDSLIAQAGEAGGRGLPVMPLTNKIREGLAKGADPERIELVLREMTGRLEIATALILDLESSLTVRDREAPVALLAEALGGVTPDEVRGLRQQAEVAGARPTSPDGLAGAARGLAFIKSADLSVDEGTALMAEAVRQGYDGLEMLDLGRQIKQRERDYREGRASLRALRTAIADGRRLNQLFRDSRPVTVERPTTRPDPGATRPRPTDRPEPTTRPERSEPPERPTRPDSSTTRTR